MDYTFLDFILINYLQVPFLTVYLVGTVLAVVFRTRLDGDALMLGIGCGLTFIGGVIGVGTQFWFQYHQINGLGVRDIVGIYTAINTYVAIVRLAGHVTLLIGVFGRVFRRSAAA